MKKATNFQKINEKSSEESKNILAIIGVKTWKICEHDLGGREGRAFFPEDPFPGKKESIIVLVTSNFLVFLWGMARAVDGVGPPGNKGAALLICILLCMCHMALEIFAQVDTRRHNGQV